LAIQKPGTWQQEWDKWLAKGMEVYNELDDDKDKSISAFK
jgi:hypothetical protein